MASGLSPNPTKARFGKDSHTWQATNRTGLINNGMRLAFLSRPAKQSSAGKKLWRQLAMTLFSSFSLFCFPYLSQQFILRAIYISPCCPRRSKTSGCLLESQLPFPLHILALVPSVLSTKVATVAKDLMHPLAADSSCC